MSPCPPPYGGDAPNTDTPKGKSDPSSVSRPSPVPGVGSAFANALRQVNAAFDRLTPEQKEEMAVGYDGLDRELDAAWLAGDRERALQAVRAWRDRWLHDIGKAER